MTVDITFYDSQTRDSATNILNDNGFEYSDHHNAWLNSNDTIYSEMDSCLYHQDDDVSYCNQCEDHFHRDGRDYVNTDGDTYCSTECAQDAGYFQHGDGEWHNYPESGLHDYHSVQRKVHKTTEAEPFLIGFEVEKEDRQKRESLEEGDELPAGWIAEHDSSLDDETGFELISPAYNLANSEGIERDFDGLQYYLDADSSYACGGHITISKWDATGYALADKNRGLFPLLMALYPRRLKSSHVRCGKYAKIRDSHDKYRPFRIDSGKIELRIISRVTSVDQLKWRYRLIKWMLESRPTLAETRDSLHGGWLREHLSKVYSDDALRAKQKLFDAFAEYFYDQLVQLENNRLIREYITSEEIAA